eukprot:1160043-Pelagomonas_calceolata.AAC.2
MTGSGCVLSISPSAQAPQLIHIPTAPPGIQSGKQGSSRPFQVQVAPINATDGLLAAHPMRITQNNVAKTFSEGDQCKNGVVVNLQAAPAAWSSKQATPILKAFAAYSMLVYQKDLLPLNTADVRERTTSQ